MLISIMTFHFAARSTLLLSVRVSRFQLTSFFRWSIGE